VRNRDAPRRHQAPPAGCVADESALARILEAEPDPFVEDLFDDLLNALSLPVEVAR
jgi:hypothetical protein